MVALLLEHSADLSDENEEEHSGIILGSRPESEYMMYTR